MGSRVRSPADGRPSEPAEPSRLWLFAGRPDRRLTKSKRRGSLFESSSAVVGLPRDNRVREFRRYLRLDASAVCRARFDLRSTTRPTKRLRGGGRWRVPRATDGLCAKTTQVEIDVDLDKGRGRIETRTVSVLRQVDFGRRRQCFPIKPASSTARRSGSGTEFGDRSRFNIRHYIRSNARSEAKLTQNVSSC
jgi:hypothetical protein